MKPRLLTCTLLLLAFGMSVGLYAETFPFDHMHYGVPDPEKTVDWYLTRLGAKRGAAPDRVVFGRTIFAFARIEPRAARNLRVAFAEGPGGVRIELVQGRTEEELIGR
jgi:catechol 2,3-dioxygenase-like lactoylglutathione lyase family enzyme